MNIQRFKMGCGAALKRNNLMTLVEQLPAYGASEEATTSGNQGFQDLTGQTLKKTIEFIETLELQLVDLLQKYRPILGLTAQAGQPAQVAEPGQEAAPQAAPQLRQSQDQVDSLLADLGF
ncbi:MAG: protein phosphatase CheZ [bacterium]